MFSSVLIGNRGEIAVRIIRTARRLGLRTVAIYSEADAQALHVRLADEAHRIGPAPAGESYLRADRLLEVARAARAECLHPGYGFLAENAEFARACAKAGIVFVGPPAEAIALMGAKDAARALMEGAGVPVLPGGSAGDASAVARLAEEIGYPLAIKPVAGGGGKGLRRVAGPDDLTAALDASRREAAAAFGDPRVLLEKWLDRPRHVEVQIFADAHGGIVHLYERDCSLQRRHQKIVEEAPAPGMTDGLRARLCEAAVAAARAVGYVGAGTVEFLVEGAPLHDAAPFYFLEMNTRLQVEHPVTEAVTGLDLVEWQFRVAAGERLPRRQQEIALAGHAIEARLCAEDPEQGFLPSSGKLHALSWPEDEGLRIDAGVEEGDLVTPHYDSLLAKVIAHGPTRTDALERLRAGLAGTRVAGPRTNLAFLYDLLAHGPVVEGRPDTELVSWWRWRSPPPDPEAVRVGAAALLAKQRHHIAARRARISPERHSPWDAGDGFTLGPPRRDHMRLFVNGAPCDVAVEWTRGGPDIRLGPGGMAAAAVLTADPRVVETDEGVIVLHGLRQIELAFPAGGPSAPDGPAAGGVVRAPMHGRIVALDAAVGQLVRAGEPIAVLEAMKMEHVLRAPLDGVVRALEACVGAQVARGALVAVIEAADAE